MNRLRIRIIFYLHAIVAVYCLACGLLDSVGHFEDWMIPNIVVFYGLFWSAIIFPLVAGICLVGSGHHHPVRILLFHVFVGIVQFMFGLLPLVS